MTAVVAEPGAARFERLPLEQITESRTNPRQTFAAGPMQELADSIRAHGMLQPILVRQLKTAQPKHIKYEVVAGARRLRAAQLAGLMEVPAIVRDLDDKQALEVQVIENLQRADLHPMEEARGYQQLLDKHGYTVEQIAAKVHKSPSYVHGRVRLCSLPRGATKLFEAGALDVSRALLVARIQVADLAEQAAREIAFGEWPARQSKGKEVPEEQRDPMTFVRASAHVQDEYMLQLARAPFPTGDIALVPAAGSCVACPKRTGNQSDLFGDVSGPDLCTDSKCFKGKADAHFARRAAEVEAGGGKVLEGKAAEGHRHAGKLVGLDDRCRNDPKARTYRKLLGKGCEDLPVTLLRTQHDDPVEMVAAADVAKALKAKGHDFAKKVSNASLDPKGQARARAHERRKRAVKIARPILIEKAAKVAEEPLLRFIVQRIAALGGSTARDGLPDEIPASYGGLTQAGVKVLLAMKAPQLRSLVVGMLIAGTGSNHYGNRYDERITAACELLDVELKTFEQAAAKEKPKKKKTAAEQMEDDMASEAEE